LDETERDGYSVYSIAGRIGKEGSKNAVLEVPPRPRGFIRGDADMSGGLSLTDAVIALNYLFLGGRAPACLDAADANDSGHVDISDAVAILSTLFMGQSMIDLPYPLRGQDATPDDLGDCGS
jgi:hypothetical protein